MQTIKYLNKAKSLYKTVSPYAKGYAENPLNTTKGSVKFMLGRVVLPVAAASAAHKIIKTKKALDKDIEAQIKSDDTSYNMQMQKIKQDRKKLKNFK